ncbi:hypothetical protein CsSME_00044183 [Camellia sinensis var. sinensis]
MEFHLLPILAFLSLTLVASHLLKHTGIRFCQTLLCLRLSRIFYTLNGWKIRAPQSG